MLTHTRSDLCFACEGGEGGPQTGTMTECFDCDNCKESLYGRKYIQMDNGPYCIPCYDAHFANTCDECKELIGHDCRVSRGSADKQLSSQGLWSPPHADCTPRSCTMRTAITTSTASVVSAATALWPMSRSPARARSCCATTATAASSPPNVSLVRRPSCQVGAGGLEHCSLFLVPWCQFGLQVQHESSTGESWISVFLPSCHSMERAGSFTCPARQSPQQPHLSVPLFHGEVNEGGDNKGFPGHFLLCADKKRQND